MTKLIQLKPKTQVTERMCPNCFHVMSQTVITHATHNFTCPGEDCDTTIDDFLPLTGSYRNAIK